MKSMHQVTLFIFLSMILQKSNGMRLNKQEVKQDRLLWPLLEFQLSDEEMLTEIKNKLRGVWIAEPYYENWSLLVWDLLTNNAFFQMMGFSGEAQSIEFISKEFVHSLEKSEYSTPEESAEKVNLAVQNANYRLYWLYQYEALNVLGQGGNFEADQFSDRNLGLFTNQLLGLLRGRHHLFVYVEESAESLLAKVQVGFSQWPDWLSNMEKSFTKVKSQIDNMHSNYPFLIQRLLKDVNTLAPKEKGFDYHKALERVNLVVDIWINLFQNTYYKDVMAQIVEYTMTAVKLLKTNSQDTSIDAAIRSELDQFFWGAVSHVLERLVMEFADADNAFRVASAYLELLIPNASQQPLVDPAVRGPMSTYCLSTKHFQNFIESSDFSDYPVFYSMLDASCALGADSAHFTNEGKLSLARNLITIRAQPSAYFAAFRHLLQTLADSQLIDHSQNPALFAEGMTAILEFLGGQLADNLDITAIPQLFGDFLAYRMNSNEVAQNVRTYILILLNFEHNYRSFTFYGYPEHDQQLLDAINTELALPVYAALNQSTALTYEQKIASKPAAVEPSLLGNLVGQLFGLAPKNEVKEPSPDKKKDSPNPPKPDVIGKLQDLFHQDKNVNKAEIPRKEEPAKNPQPAQEEKPKGGNGLFGFFKFYRLLI